jgi:ribonuclease J
VIVDLKLDADTHEMLEQPEFISRGFVYVPDAGDLMAGAQKTIRSILYNHNGASKARDLRPSLEDSLEHFFYNETKRRPMVFTLIHEVIR